MANSVFVLLFFFAVSFSSSFSFEVPSVVNIGVVLAYDSVIGRVAKVAIQVAVEDVNADTGILRGTQLNLVMNDSQCSPFLGAVGVFQALDQNVVAIIGPQSSVEVHMVSSISTALQIPFISFAATDPTLSSLQFPFLMRTVQSDAYQMSAMSELMHYFGWKKVIAVFTDDDYGRNGINYLDDELAKKMCKVYKIALPFKPNRENIAQVLQMSKIIGPRVYVVHVNSDSGLDIFLVAQQLDMMTEGYAWFATDWLSTYLDTYADFEQSKESSLSHLQGVVGFRRYIRQSSLKDTFVSRWNKLQNEGNVTFNLNAYGFYAYDAVWALAHAIDDYLKESENFTFSINKDLLITKGSMNLEMLKTFDGGRLLREKFFRLNFTELSLQVQFDSDRNLTSSMYEVINVDGKLLHKVGYWSNHSGFSNALPEISFENHQSNLRVNQSLGNVTWPGGKTEAPRGWVVASADRPLKIGVPYRAGYVEFVTVLKNTSKVEVHGYCIDVFRAAIKLLQYDVPFEFVPVGDGINNPDYDRFVKMVSDEVIDAAIGDIAIVTDRSKTVDFTQPYISAGLVILAPIKTTVSDVWVFYRPFTAEMWCTSRAFFFLMAVVVWLLEHRVNNAFRGPPRRQCLNMILFSFSTPFKSQREKILSVLGRFVMIVWLFLLLIIPASYIASLASILTMQQLSSPIKDINTLVASNEAIGYQVGSFARAYLANSFKVQRSRLVALGSLEAYKYALERGPKRGGVAAIIDELPYVESFLEKTKGFGLIGQTLSRSGWGFAFPRDSQLAIDISRAILTLSENGELQRIHRDWFCKTGCISEFSESTELNQLQLRHFWRLFLVCATAIIAAIFIYFLRAIRLFVQHNSSRQNDLSSAFQQEYKGCSWLFVRFFKFISEKEVANKVVKQQTENNAPQLAPS